MWGGALIYCIVCSLFKGSEVLNINNATVRALADLFYNIGISIIAAYTFLLFQSWLYFRREGIVVLYARRYVRLYLLQDCYILLAELEEIKNGSKDECEINNSIALVCERIKQELYICTTKYREGLSDAVFEYIEELFFDDEFYMIEKRANGKLPNMSMKHIVNNLGIYGRMKLLIMQLESEDNY